MEIPEGELEWFFPFEDLGYEVSIHDNGRVIYAYLHRYNDDDELVSYTWLYNRCEAPQVAEWISREEEPPYAMPADFVENKVGFKLPTEDSQMGVSSVTADGLPPYFAIYFEKKLIGLLDSVTHPGWARLINRDSPIAKVLDDEMLYIFENEVRR